MLRTLRAMSLSELLDTSFGVYRAAFMPLVTIALCVQLLPMVFGVYLETSGGTFANVGLAVGSILIGMVLGYVGAAASTFLVASIYHGEPLTGQQALLKATPFIGRLVVLSLLTGLLGMIGFLFFIVPGIMVMCGMVVATPALVLENHASPTEAMRRSWALTSGFKMKIFGAAVVAMLLLAIPTMALGTLMLLGTVFSDNPLVSIVVGVVLQSLLGVLIYPFVYTMITLFYYDLRIRKEGYDIELMASAAR